MEATAFTDRSNRKEKACKKEESIYKLRGAPVMEISETAKAEK
jgi:hypothetical protein